MAVSAPLAALLAEDVAAVAARPLPWERLSGAHVLVTGASGFLGGWFVRCLLALHRLGKVERPVRVTAVVRDPARARERLADLIEAPNLTLLAWDLTRLELPPWPADVDRVVHAASLASPRHYGVDPVGTILPNAVGTAALLERLGRGGRAEGFLFISSSEVYGAVNGAEPLAESDYGVVDPAAVRACYAESKRLGEALCVAWHHQHGLPTHIVRPFHTYGPGLRPDDGRVFADFVHSAARGEPLVMTSDGAARRAFCYVSDAVAGCLTAWLSGQPGRPYNVANPAGECSIAELAELLAGLDPARGLRVVRQAAAGGSYLPSPYSRLSADVSALEALGWRPHVTLEDGFRRTIEATAWTL
jgi:dTDP-glucose 4,6-dehydratase